jgi:hypothetical protein
MKMGRGKSVGTLFSVVMAGLKEKFRQRENREENCRLIDDEKERIDIGQ